MPLLSGVRRTAAGLIAREPFEGYLERILFVAL